VAVEVALETLNLVALMELGEPVVVEMLESQAAQEQLIRAAAAVVALTAHNKLAEVVGLVS
jgi:hypothetical protein